MAARTQSISSRVVGEVIAGVLFAGVLAASGCGQAENLSEASKQRPVTIRVLAASSLADVLPQLVAAFRRTDPAVRVEASTGPSSALVAQVDAGVDADLVITADRDTALAARPKGGPAPAEVATNVMVIGVPKGNPGNVRSLTDLGRTDLLVGWCAPQVPCGRYSRRIVDLAGVRPAVDTEEPDAKSLVAKIAAGDLDAGLVYRTDVRANSPEVRAIAIPQAASVPVRYFAVDLHGGRRASEGRRSPEGRRAAADAFTAFMLAGGRPIFTAAGFGAP
ncbi:MAG: substrate-binding domain-containing protein [Actinomycetes bacterium]